MRKPPTPPPSPTKEQERYSRALRRAIKKRNAELTRNTIDEQPVAVFVHRFKNCAPSADDPKLILRRERWEVLFEAYPEAWPKFFRSRKYGRGYWRLGGVKLNGRNANPLISRIVIAMAGMFDHPSGSTIGYADEDRCNHLLRNLVVKPAKRAGGGKARASAKVALETWRRMRALNMPILRPFPGELDD